MPSVFYNQTASGWVEIGSWSTTPTVSRKHIHDIGNHFNETNGRFIAPVDGLYFVSAQVRVDNINADWWRLLVTINGNQDLHNGLHAIMNSDAASSAFGSLSVSGVVKLDANDYLSVQVYSHSDTSWSIVGESGFSAYLVNKL